MPDEEALTFSAPTGDSESRASRVDLTKVGKSDNPQEDWGEPADEGAAYSANHARRAELMDAKRSQGVKTRTAYKDIVSRRS